MRKIKKIVPYRRSKIRSRRSLLVKSNNDKINIVLKKMDRKKSLLVKANNDKINIVLKKMDKRYLRAVENLKVKYASAQ